MSMATEIVGWAAALILLVTIGSQVWQQWRTRSTQGVSPWLFAGQVLASAGFTAYSLLLGNMVFTVTNTLILLSAVFGQLLYWRNRGKAPAIVESLAGSAGVPVARLKRASRKRATPRAEARRH
jgi:MtN3 and saliva related transmembrane protein